MQPQQQTPLIQKDLYDSGSAYKIKTRWNKLRHFKELKKHDADPTCDKDSDRKKDWLRIQQLLYYFFFNIFWMSSYFLSFFAAA